MRKTAFLLTILFALSLTMISCNDENDDSQNSDMAVPQNFKVDIPSSMSSSDSRKATTVDEPINGKDLYENLRTFINVGEEAAEVVEDLMKAISTHNLSQEMEITFVSDEDGREKNLKVTENVSFEAKSYQYQLDMADNDGAMALQIFWNSSPVEGISIVSPYDFDRNIDEIFAATRYRVDYSETGDKGYDQDMTVYISDFPQFAGDRFGLDNLKMFVGKLGDQIDIYGNSNHPNLWIFDENGQVGYDWAFHARADANLNIAVAEVGLPPSMHESTADIFSEYSLYKVLSAEFHAIYDPIYNAELVEQYLQGILANAQAPAFFNADGFVAAGTAPEGYSDDFITIAGLVPYIPKDIAQLQVSFAAAISK